MKRYHLAVLAALGLAMLTGLAHAQGYPAPVDRSGSMKAGQELRTAQNELLKANVSLAAVVAKLNKEFEASAEYKSAADAQKAAKTEYESARRPLLEALSQKPEYQAAKMADDKAEAEKEKVINDPNASPEQRLAAANAALQAASVASKMEAESLAADPKFAEAKTKLAEATAKLQAMIREFHEGMKNNGEWSGAKSAIDAAKQKVESAQKALAEARTRENEQERQRQQQIADMNRKNRNNNNNNNNRR